MERGEAAQRQPTGGLGAILAPIQPGVQNHAAGSSPFGRDPTEGAAGATAVDLTPPGRLIRSVG